jgi:sulfur carrier protein
MGALPEGSVFLRERSSVVKVVDSSTLGARVRSKRPVARASDPVAKFQMRAIVNGEERLLEEGTTVLTLLAELELAGRRVAVELNRDVVPRSEYELRVLADGDQVEIVHFVGGG